MFLWKPKRKMKFSSVQVLPNEYLSYSSDLQIVVVKWFVLSKGCTWDVRCSAPTTSLYRSASANSVPVEELSEVQDITILCHNFCGVWVLKWIF